MHQGPVLTLFVSVLLVRLAAASADRDAAIAEHQAVQIPPAAVDSLAAVGFPASFETAHQHQHAERHHQQVDPVGSRPLLPLVLASGPAPVSQAADFAADAALSALLPAGPAPGPALTVVAGSATVKRYYHAAVVWERALRDVWVDSPGTLVAAKRFAGPELAQRTPLAPSQHIAAWPGLPAVRLTFSTMILATFFLLISTTANIYHIYYCLLVSTNIYYYSYLLILELLLHHVQLAYRQFGYRNNVYTCDVSSMSKHIVNTSVLQWPACTEGH